MVQRYNRGMSNELHIQLKPDVVDPPEDILDGFPFEQGQSIVSYSAGIIIVTLGEADDTNYVQDWYLNSNDEIYSFYVVEG